MSPSRTHSSKRFATDRICEHREPPPQKQKKPSAEHTLRTSSSRTGPPSCPSALMYLEVGEPPRPTRSRTTLPRAPTRKNQPSVLLPTGCHTTSQLPFGCRSEEHTFELQSLMRISYAVFCLKKKNNNKYTINHIQHTYP